MEFTLHSLYLLNSNKTVKKALLFILAIFCFNSTFAQDATEEKITDLLSMGNY